MWGKKGVKKGRGLDKIRDQNRDKPYTPPIPTIAITRVGIAIIIIFHIWDGWPSILR